MFGKSSLSLLEDYGNNSSDEEVSGPRVSTKRVYSEDKNYSCKRLPVPLEFTRKNGIDHRDDPGLHEGRIRSFPHERGNWASFVCIPLVEYSGLQRLLDYLNELIPRNINMKQCTDFHISLTRTVILRYIWINPLVETIQSYVRCFKKFVIVLGNAKVYCNEEKTRTFVGIEIKSGHDTLLKLVENLDKCLSEFNLPPFYKDPSFHISIAWCVGDREEELHTFLEQINKKLDLLKENFPEDNWYSVAEHLLCKIGNKQFQFNLN